MSNYRIQIDISEEQLSELETLMGECGFSTKKELFDNAIALLKWATKKAKKGLVVASINEKDKQYNELKMPFLQNIQEKVTAS
jgi:hypothetical protein